MKAYLRKYISSVIIIVSIIIAALMIMAKSNPEVIEKSYIPPKVETQPVIFKQIKTKIASQGSVTPQREILLAPEITGKIQEVSSKFMSGAIFEAGDILLKIEKRDFELALIASEANLSQAKVNYERELAESKLAAEEWGRINGGEASDLTLRKPQLAQARALLAAAEANYEQAQRNLNRTNIRAPFNGRVVSKNADVGMVVNPSVSLAKIYATDIMEVILPISEKDIEFLDIPLSGSSIRNNIQPNVRLFTEYGGDSFSWNGKINRTVAEIDPKTRMLSVVAQVKNLLDKDNKSLPLKKGMFVSAEIEGLELSGVVIAPRHTVRDGRIWIVDKEGILKHKAVNILRYEDEYAFIESGLSSDDSILLTRLGVLVDGMKLNQK